MNFPNLKQLLWSKYKVIDMLRKRDIPQVLIPADTDDMDTWELQIFRAPAICKIKEIHLIPAGDIGQGTNYMTLSVQDKGTDTILTSLDVNSTHTIEGNVGVNLLSEDKELAKGYVLTLKKEVTGDGQLFPGGLVQVFYEIVDKTYLNSTMR